MAGMFAAKPFTTALTPQQEASYSAWQQRLPYHLRSDEDYDLRGAFLDNAQEAANGHLTDKFKKPNHMTFSDDSQYSNTSNMGGQWVGSDKTGWAFYASPYNLSQHNSAQMRDYFDQAEPDAGLLLPIDWSLPPRKIVR